MFLGSRLVLTKPIASRGLQLLQLAYRTKALNTHCGPIAGVAIIRSGRWPLRNGPSGIPSPLGVSGE